MNISIVIELHDVYLTTLAFCVFRLLLDHFSSLLLITQPAVPLITWSLPLIMHWTLEN